MREKDSNRGEGVRRKTTEGERVYEESRGVL